MEEDGSQLRSTSVIAMVLLGVLFVAGIVFYKARLLFGDASFIAFNVLNWKMFYIQEHRYGSFITQWVPYVGGLLHMPLRWILVAYTASFNFFYLLAAVIMHRLRQYHLVVVMALYYVLFVSATWFWTNNEIHQAVAWMFLMLAVLLHMGQRQMRLVVVLPVFLVLGFLAVFTHFIVLIPLTFLWVYLILDGAAWPFGRNRTLLYSACLAVLAVLKFVMVGNSSYDAGHLHNATNVSPADIVSAFNSGVVRVFAKRCLTNYWVAGVVLACGMYALLKAGRTWLAGWTLLCCAGYVFLVGVTYGPYGGDIMLFHIESEWQSLGIVVGAPFVLCFLPRLRGKHAVCSLLLIFVVRLGYIGAFVPQFTWRTAFKERVLQQMQRKGITRLALCADTALERRCMNYGALAEESILMSGMAGDSPQRTFFFADTADKALMRKMADRRETIVLGGDVKAADWNLAFFKPDTLHPYRLMTYAELFR